MSVPFTGTELETTGLKPSRSWAAGLTQAALFPFWAGH